MAIMAGMLAGAESARRRQQQQRLRQAGSAAANSVAGNEAKHNSSVATKRIVRSNNNNNNNYMNRELHDWSLGSGAREAKERLDEKLRNQRASVMRRRYNVASTVGALQKEIFSYRKSARRFDWSRLAWNNNKTAAEAKPYRAATECAVCLEEFRAGDELTHLPCAHRFHRSCAAPWLEISPCCPFCRACIFSF